MNAKELGELPAYPTGTIVLPHSADGEYTTVKMETETGMPIRLKIAVQVMAAAYGAPLDLMLKDGNIDHGEQADLALAAADALLEAYVQEENDNG